MKKKVYKINNKKKKVYKINNKDFLPNSVNIKKIEDGEGIYKNNNKIKINISIIDKKRKINTVNNSNKKFKKNNNSPP